MILATDPSPAGDGVDCLPLCFGSRSLNSIPDAVLDTGTGFQNAVDAPVFMKPVEVSQFLRCNFNLRKCVSTLMYGCKTDAGGGFHAIIHRDLTHDPWCEVAEFFIIFTLLIVLDFTQASICYFVIRCVVDLLFVGHSSSSISIFLAVTCFCSLFISCSSFAKR